MFSLAEAWQVAQDHIQKSQHKQKKSYDMRTKTRVIRVGDRVMVLMPQEQTGKNRKLHRPYFGPYRVLEFTQMVQPWFQLIVPRIHQSA